jgi:hypothetical protein
MGFKFSFSKGQAMVEYIVITAALVAALLTANNDSLSGLVQGQGSIASFEDAVQDKQRGYSYALSLSAIPETDDLVELADYYDSLGKFPELSTEIRSGGSAIRTFVTGVQDFIAPLQNFSIPSIPSISSINPF